MQTKFVALPLAGSIRHGEKQEKNGKVKPIELGYFVAKTQDVAMQHLQTKFQEQYNSSKILNIYFLDENPFSIRRVRYNQSGVVCYCSNDQTQGKEKTNKQWKDKECTENCEHRSAPEGKKPQCVVEGTLKFMIPDVSNDRIWYLKTTSFYSIQNISSYITLQKTLNNSLVGNYKLFLKPKESIINDKTYNNFVLDIVKSDNFISNQISNQTSTMIENTNPTPKNTKKIQEKKPLSPPAPPDKLPIEDNSDKPIDIAIPKSQKKEPTDEDLNRYYVLLETKNVTLKKDGVPTAYLEATLYDKDSKEVRAIIHPKYAKDMSLCELGSQFLMDIEKFGERLIVNNCEYLFKQLKEAV